MMNRVAMMALMLAGASPVMAQRVDGCPTPESSVSKVNMLDPDAVTSGLQRLYISPIESALTQALSDARPDARSLAALKLVESDPGARLGVLLKAWLAEEDYCTKGIIGHALNSVMSGLTFDSAHHPGHQPWVTPFQPCNAAAAPVVTLRLEESPQIGADGATLRIIARNETPQTLAFVGTFSPEELFSVTVLTPSGKPAEIPERLASAYRPVAPGYVTSTHGRHFVALPPHQDVGMWIWKVSDDFIMSEPGNYQVSMGGSMAYLGAKVCSNTLELNIGK